MNQSHFNEAEIHHHLVQTFGAGCKTTHIEALKSGARKQVFLLDLTTPDMRCVLYIWQDAHHYFIEREILDTTQSDEQAPLLFQANSELLQRLGVNTPKVYYFGQLEAGPFFAIVEYISAKNFTAFLTSASPEARASVLEQIGMMLRTLNDVQRSYPGTLLDKEPVHFKLPYKVALERALLELNVTAQHHIAVNKNRERVENKLRTLNARIKPKDSYRLIHGELGPEHILIRPESNSPCFVDIDGTHFSDVEIEHTLLDFRFEHNDMYEKYLKRKGLDDARMEFYRFALHVSLFYAGSRFLAKQFHDEAWAQGLFDFNLKCVLAAL
jgi:Phosphotransferase enzyme family